MSKRDKLVRHWVFAKELVLDLCYMLRHWRRKPKPKPRVRFWDADWNLLFTSDDGTWQTDGNERYLTCDDGSRIIFSGTATHEREAPRELSITIIGGGEGGSGYYKDAYQPFDLSQWQCAEPPDFLRDGTTRMGYKDLNGKLHVEEVDPEELQRIMSGQGSTPKPSPTVAVLDEIKDVQRSLGLGYGGQVAKQGAVVTVTAEALRDSQQFTLESIMAANERAAVARLVRQEDEILYGAHLNPNIILGEN